MQDRLPFIEFGGMPPVAHPCRGPMQRHVRYWQKLTLRPWPFACIPDRKDQRSFLLGHVPSSCSSKASRVEETEMAKVLNETLPPLSPGSWSQLRACSAKQKPNGRPRARPAGCIYRSRPAEAFHPTPLHSQTAGEAIPNEPTAAWFKIVAALNRDSAWLGREDRRFVSYMLGKLSRNPAYVPTAPQSKWVLHISAKLGRD